MATGLSYARAVRVRQSGSECPTLDQVLGEILAELRAIRELLARPHRAPAHLTRADYQQLSKLLPVVVVVFGSELFTCRELLDHHNAGLRIVLAGFNARSLGRLLRRGEGQSVDGYVVERVGIEVGSALRRVLVAS